MILLITIIIIIKCLLCTNDIIILFVNEDFNTSDFSNLEYTSAYINNFFDNNYLNDVDHYSPLNTIHSNSINTTSNDSIFSNANTNSNTFASIECRRMYRESVTYSRMVVDPENLTGRFDEDELDYLMSKKAIEIRCNRLVVLKREILEKVIRDRDSDSNLSFKEFLL